MSINSVFTAHSLPTQPVVNAFPWTWFDSWSMNQNYKQTQEKKSTLRCALSLLFSHGPWGKNSTPRKEAHRKVDFFSWGCLSWISSLECFTRNHDLGSYLAQAYIHVHIYSIQHLRNSFHQNLDKFWMVHWIFRSIIYSIWHEYEIHDSRVTVLSVVIIKA